MRWPTSIISAHKKLGQEEQEFEVSLSDTARCCLSHVALCLKLNKIKTSEPTMLPYWPLLTCTDPSTHTKNDYVRSLEYLSLFMSTIYVSIVMNCITKCKWMLEVQVNGFSFSIFIETFRKTNDYNTAHLWLPFIRLPIPATPRLVCFGSQSSFLEFSRSLLLLFTVDMRSDTKKLKSCSLH